jgi:hypothetical protein
VVADAFGLEAATVPQCARFRCRPQTPGALIQRCGQASRLAAKPLDNRCILHPIIIAEDSEFFKLFMRWLLRARL